MIATIFALACVTATPTGTASTKAFAIVNARVEVGDGTVQTGVLVLVDGERIVKVGAIAPPVGVTVIDGKGKVLTPGFIHTGSQLGLVEVALEDGTVDSGMHDGGPAPGFLAIDAYNPASPHVAIHRAQGVTSVVLSPEGRLLSGTAYVVDLSGSPVSITRATRAGVTAGFGSDAKADAGGTRGGVVLRFREFLDDTRFFMNNRAAYDSANARTLSLPRVHLEALVPVAQATLPLLVRVDRAADIRSLLRFANDTKVRVVVVGGAEAWMVKDELAQARVPVVLCPSSGEPATFDAIYARDDNATLLDAAGVVVIVTSTGTDTNTTRVRQEAGVAVSYGLPYAKAIAAVTSVPARVFGVDKEVGTITAGKRADLVLWSGDPFETSTNAEAVWIAGQRMDMGTRQRALAERYQKANAAAKPTAGAK